MTVSFLGLEVQTIEGGFQTRRTRRDWLLANRTVQFPALFAVLPSDADVTRSRIFATPASAQASSLSPPGASRHLGIGRRVRCSRAHNGGQSNHRGKSFCHDVNLLNSAVTVDINLIRLVRNLSIAKIEVT